MRIIAGTFKNRVIKTPKTKETRPTSGVIREAVFNICQSKIVGAKVLDLFAGSGAIGLEALSRGAKSVDFVESSKIVARCILENIKELDVKDRAKLYQMDVFLFLSRVGKFKKKYDIIYIDPPYLKVKFEEKTAILEQISRINLLENEGIIFLEEGLVKEPYEYKIDGFVIATRQKANMTLHQLSKSGEKENK